MRGDDLRSQPDSTATAADENPEAHRRARLAAAAVTLFAAAAALLASGLAVVMSLS